MALKSKREIADSHTIATIAINFNEELSASACGLGF